MINWLKRSPANPTYSATQKKKDKLAENAEKTDEDVFHKYLYFYKTDMLDIPEFRFENKKDQFKPKDIALLEEYLKEREIEDEKRRVQKEADALAAATPGGAAVGKGGKADPKKDAAKGKDPKAKGTVVADDKNCPQPITVEYPTINEIPNFLIMEKNFAAKTSSGEKVGSKKAAATTGGKENKNKERLDELLKKYKVIRSLPYSVAVHVRLNKDEKEPEVEIPEPVAEVVDPKAAGKKK